MLTEAQLVLPKPRYDYITNEESARKALMEMDRYGVLGMDTECTDLDPYEAKVSLIQLSIPNKAFVFDVRHDTPHSSLHIDVLKPILTGQKLKILQNATYDMEVLKANYGFYVENIYDTMLVEQLLHLGLHAKSSLDYLVKKYLGLTMDKHPRDTFKDYWQKFQPFQIEYAASDAVVMHDIRNLQLPKIKDHGLEDVCRLEFEFTKPLCEMELNGMMLDVEKWRAIMGDAAVEMEEASRSVAEFLAPVEDQTTLFGVSVIDVNSPQQLLGALIRYGLPVENTSNPELIKYKGMPLIDAILDYRKYAKLVSTYAETLIEKINRHTGRLHTQFRQMVATGRMSSSNPNLQNIPKKQIYRSCFVAPEGRKLITADMSGAELRILGNLSRDPIFVESYAHGIDLHTRTASEIFGVPMDKVKHHQRDAAKALNFGLCASEDTDLITDIGMVKIKDVTVDSKTAHDAGSDTIIDKMYMGDKEVFEIETQYGYKLEVTGDHLIKVIDKEGRYIDKELKKINLDTDYVCLKTASCIFAQEDFVFPDFVIERRTNYTHFDLPKKINKEWAAFLGLFVSEGSISKVKGRSKYSCLQFGFSDKDVEFIEKIDSLLYSLFGSRITRCPTRGKIQYSLNSVLFCEWLAAVCNIRDFSKTNNITIPNCIKQSSREIQTEFLKWLFEGDGSAKKNGNGYRITYSSKSCNLVSDLKTMLLNFGILSSLIEEGRSDYPGEVYYELQLVSDKSRSEFCNNIGFLTSSKNSKCVNNCSKTQSSYFLPNQSKRLNSIIDLRTTKEKQDRSLYDIIYNAKKYTKGLGNIYFERLSKYDDFIKFIYENNIVPLPIKSIKSVGVKKVYDLSVENHQYFLANGFIVHNCYGLSKFGLARRLKISEKEAEDIINNYFQRYQGVKRFLDQSAKDAVYKRFSRTVSGRKRFYRLPAYSDPNFKNIKRGIERQAKNAGIQGANADTIKQSMIYLVDRLEKGGYDAQLISTVHDEVIVESAENQAHEVAEVTVQALKDGFGRYFDLISMESDALVGPCWLKNACERKMSGGKECGGTEMVSVLTDDKYKTKVVCKKCGGDI